MTKKTNTESQKSKFYDASEILKHEQDGTTYILRRKSEVSRFVEYLKDLDGTKEHTRGVIAARFDMLAEDLREQFYESSLFDMYYSSLRELNDERLKYMAKIGNCINFNNTYISSLTDWREKIKTLDETTILLVEYYALLNQCDRAPWRKH